MSPVPVRVDMRDTIRLANKLFRLSPNVQKAGMALVNRTADWIKKSARRRAPFFEGDLKDSIRIENKGSRNKEVIAGDLKAPYAPYQEFGFKEHRVFVPGKPKLERYVARIGKANIKSIVVSKHKPFLLPAAQRAVHHIPAWIDEIVGEAMIKSGFKRV